MATTEQPPAAPPEEQQAERFCPTCGAAYEPLQEYCLECGTRLPVNQGLTGVLASAWQRRLAWYPGDWIWPTLAFLVLAVAATAVTVAVAAGGATKSSIPNQATNNVTVGPGASQGSVAVTTRANTFSPPEPTVTTGPLPTAPGSGTTTPPATTPKPAPNPNALAVWPAGKSGFTVVLESIPVSNGISFAEQRARRAKQAGLPQVGVLNSSAYSSLHPGYYAVFSGIYGSNAQAVAAASSAHVHGYPDAFPKAVTK
jgi:hypothetical protein